MTGISVSLADEMALRDLSEETRDLLTRLYQSGRMGVALGVTLDVGNPSSTLLAAAYRRGYNDCIDDIETPWKCSNRTAEETVARLLKDGELT